MCINLEVMVFSSLYWLDCHSTQSIQSSELHGLSLYHVDYTFGTVFQ